MNPSNPSKASKHQTNRMTHEYLYLLKNLRAVAALLPEDSDTEAVVKWLARRYRNRKVGYLPEASERASDTVRAALVKAPFVSLDCPDSWPVDASRRLESERLCLQLLAVSCHYVSPLVGTRQLATRPEWAAAVCWQCTFSGPLDERNRKFNLRLGDYAMTDFLIGLVPRTLDRLQNLQDEKSLSALIEWRRREADKDGRTRYWRLLEMTQKGDEPALCVTYLDPLALVQHHRIAGAGDLERIKAFGQSHPEMLNLVVAVGLSV